MAGRLTIVGLGPAGPELITPQVTERLAATPTVRLRTARHPAAAVVEAPSYDHVYEAADRFADVYEEIARDLLALAAVDDLVYAVPGSPLVLERTVELVREAATDMDLELEILPAVSFLDTVWSRLQVDPIEAGVRLIDGHVFATAAAGQTGPLLVAHAHANHVLSDIKLAFEEPPATAIILQRLGLPDERIVEVAWADLDRELEADHLTSLYLPEVAEPVAHEFARFDELVRTLRDECPWDRKQTHASLRRHLLEETHEVLEVLDARAALADTEPDPDLDDHLAEELGDLLYQIYFHARLASERGSFTVADVARGVHDKLVIRHPHVFGDVEADDAETAVSTWEEIKAQEKQRDSVLDGIPPSLPGLALAAKIQKRRRRPASTGMAESRSPTPTSKQNLQRYETIRASTKSVISCLPGCRWPAGSMSTRRLRCAVLPSGSPRGSVGSRCSPGAPKRLPQLTKISSLHGGRWPSRLNPWQTDGPGTAEHPRARAVRAKSLTLRAKPTSLAPDSAISRTARSFRHEHH